MACGAAALDFRKQREVLDRLREEVQALDAENGHLCESLEVEFPAPVLPSTQAQESLSRESGLRCASSSAPGRLRPPVPETVQACPLLTETERPSRLASELMAKEGKVQELEAMQAAAKAAWDRSLKQCTASEARGERRLAAMRREFESLRGEEAQEEMGYRAEKEKLQQRLRLVRMHLQQAEKARRQARVEALSQGHGALLMGSSTGADAGEPIVASKLRDAEDRVSVKTDEVRELRLRLAELEGRLERGRPALRSEEALVYDNQRILEERVQLQDELRASQGKAEHAKRESSRLQGERKRALKLLREHEKRAREEQACESEAIRSIDRYLQVETSGEARQVLLAEWLEAAIGVRQAELVQNRLTTLVEDTAARTSALETAVGEIHEDLNRRASLILELERRLNSLLLTGESESDAAGAVDGIEQQALEEELRNQREVFTLRSQQVQTLELRLCEALECQGPRTRALKVWIDVHRPIALEQLERCTAVDTSKSSLRADLDAMRRDKSEQVVEREEASEIQRRKLLAMGKEARQSAEEEAASSAALDGQCAEILKRVDKLLKLERGMSMRTPSCGKRSVSAARPVERDAGADRAAEVDVELRRVSTALERACEQKVAASHAVVVLEAEAESEAHVGCTRAGCASGASAELRAARQHSQREKDVQQAQEQLCLREGEHQEHQLIRRQRRERTLEEMQELEAALGAVRRRGRACVNESLKELRTVSEMCAEEELACSELRARCEGFEERSSWTPRSGRFGSFQSPSGVICSSSTRGNMPTRTLSASSHREGTRDVRVAEIDPGPARSASLARDGSAFVRSTTPVSKRGPAKTAASPRPRAPTIVDIQRRTEGDPELFNFYINIFPLLQGTSIEVFRRPKQQFEPRQMMVSRDLLRLELWQHPESRDAGPQRRPRIAEVWARVESLVRLHVPKGTLLAVQNAILGKGADPRDEDDVECQTSLPDVSGPFAFDLVLGGSEPWRLAATSLRSFHVVTAAIGVLVGHKSLPSVAAALGLSYAPVL